jgi:bifunctional DNase/RNase
MVKVEIEGVVLNLLNNSPVVILKSSGGKILPISVGIFEAQAILLALERTSFPRPLTHDLMKNIIEAFGYRFLRLEISGVKNNVYYAAMVLESGEGAKTIDCRPSDGMALALRFNAPILSEEKLMERVEIVKYFEGNKKFVRAKSLEKPIGKKEVENFRKVIENISAREFWEKLKKE